MPNHLQQGKLFNYVKKPMIKILPGYFFLLFL